jgi:glutamine synthetase
MSSSDVLKLIQEKEAKWADLRFTDTRGKEQQCEIGVGDNTLVKKVDKVQILKYALHNVGARHNKSVTFMPRPLVGDNGSGMHVHQSLAKEGKNIFAGDQYAGLSETCLYYIGGIIKHARAINAPASSSSAAGCSRTT